GSIVEKRVQKRILDEHLGELPVGDAFVVETDHTEHPYMVYAPTMRVPMDVDETDYAYVSMWAALTAIHRHNRDHTRKIESVVCVGLGTGTGRIHPTQAAYHMAQAWKNYQNPPRHMSWGMADKRHYHVEFVGKNLKSH
ncbi:MAG: phage tail protein, partial [Chloroflexota bacterium]